MKLGIAFGLLCVLSMTRKSLLVSDTSEVSVWMLRTVMTMNYRLTPRGGFGERVLALGGLVTAADLGMLCRCAGDGGPRADVQHWRCFTIAGTSSELSRAAFIHR